MPGGLMASLLDAEFPNSRRRDSHFEQIGQPADDSNPGRSVEISKQPPDFCHHCKFALIFHMSPPLKLAKALWNPHAHLPFAQCGCCTRNRRIASASALATPRLVSP